MEQWFKVHEGGRFKFLKTSELKRDTVKLMVKWAEHAVDFLEYTKGDRGIGLSNHRVNSMEQFERNLYNNLYDFNQSGDFPTNFPTNSP